MFHRDKAKSAKQARASQHESSHVMTFGGTAEGSSRSDSPEAQRRKQIAEAAYFLAEQRGFAPGSELYDWLRAEAQIDAKLPQSTEDPV